MKTLITIINLFVFIIMSYGQDDLWLTTSSESVRAKDAPEEIATQMPTKIYL